MTRSLVSSKSVPKKLGSACEDLAERFLTCGYDVVESRVIAGWIKAIRIARNLPKGTAVVTQDEYSHWIANVREYLELHKGVTLWNVPRVGYKVTSPDELAIYTAKSVKRTIVMADRTTRLIDIVDKKRMPSALRSVFLDEEGKIRNIGKSGRKYITLFTQYMKGDGRKLIASRVAA